MVFYAMLLFVCFYCGSISWLFLAGTCVTANCSSASTTVCRDACVREVLQWWSMESRLRSANALSSPVLQICAFACLYLVLLSFLLLWDCHLWYCVCDAVSVWTIASSDAS